MIYKFQTTGTKRINILIYAQSLAEAQAKFSTAGNAPKPLLVARLPKS
ncbi:hypothetical protein [Glaesserella sp.]